MKEKLFSLYVLFLFMFAPITGCLTYLTGRIDGEGQLTNIALIVSVCCWYFFFKEYLFGKDAVPRKTRKTFLYIGIFGVVYLITRMVYISNSSHNLMLPGATMKGVVSSSFSFFLRWASLCVGAFITGTLLVKKNRLDGIGTFIPYFTIPLTFVLSQATYMGEATYSTSDDLYGFNYQNISYYHASFILYNAYYTFFYNTKSRWEYVLKIFSCLCLLLNIVFSLSAGGRGAFVILLLTVVYIAYKTILHTPNIIRNALLVALVICGFFMIGDYMHVWDSDGFYRVTHMLEIDSGARNELSDYAFKAMADSYYLGSGLSSVWFTIGYPSHNVFQDITIELGVIGLIVFLIIMFKTYKKLLFFSRIDRRYELIVLNSFNIVLLLFSSYWVSNQNLWFTWGCVVAMALNETSAENDIS